MDQKIIIRESDYTVETEDIVEKKFKFNYLSTSFSEYEFVKNYFHLQVGNYDGLNIYIELNKYQMQDVIKLLQEKVDSMY